MKLKQFFTALFLLIFTLTALYAQADQLTIIHVNDTHSHLVPWGTKNASDIGTTGGIARIATLIGTLKMTSPNPITLHAGDVFGGDFMFNKFYGVPEFQLMAALGFDAMTLGNHEFNYYPTTLVGSLQAAGFPGLFPLLSANLDMTGFPNLDPFVQDYIIKQYGNTKVGIFGLTTEQTNMIANPEPVIITDDSTAAAAIVDTLKAKGCNLIVLLSHLGVLPDQLLAATVPGIDIIVGGHSHTMIPTPIIARNMYTGDTTYIVQADWAGLYVGKLSIEVQGNKVKIADYQLLPVNESVPEEPTTAATITGLKAMVEGDARFGPVYNKIIAEAVSEHPKELGSGEFKDTKLGDLITDALRDTAKTDIAFAANGFIRQNIYPGKLNEADIFQVLPEGLNPVTGYGSGVSRFELDAKNVVVGLEFSVALLEYEDTFFLNVSGLTFDFNSQKQPGTRVDMASIRINGQPLDFMKRYTVAINSDLVELLALTGIDTIYNVETVALSEYGVLREYIKKNSPIDHPGGNRIRDLAKTGVAQYNQPSTVAKSYFIDQNYPNPFNPSTTINYSVPVSGNVRVSIYNSRGQEICVLCETYHQPGEYKINWEGIDQGGNKVSSGVYFYRLKADNVVMARRMVLAK